MKKLLIVSSLFLLSACTGSIKPVESLATVKSDEVVLVGKIRLIPRMTQDQQGLPSNTVTFGMDTTMVHIALDNQRKSMSEYTGFGMTKYFATVGQEELFMVAVKKNKPFIYNGSMLIFGAGQRYILPGGIEFDVNGKDKVIYMGTIVYHRDDYDGIKKVEFINEYTEARAAVQKKFGKNTKLRKLKYKKLKK